MSSHPDQPIVRLIINGRAKLSARLRKSLQRAVRDLGSRDVIVETLITEAPLDAERFAQEACTEQHAAVFAVGGDGTLHQVINGVMKQGQQRCSKVAVGVIPTGTANDLAGCLNVTSDDAYKMLMAFDGDCARWLDLGRVKSRYFINFVTGGFGAEASSKLPLWLKSVYGTEAYFANGARQILQATPRQGCFQSSDWRWEGRFFAFAIGNSWQAGGCVLCPDAQLDDGELDLCIIPAHVELHKLLTSWVNGPIKAVSKLLLFQNPLQHGVIGYLLEYYKELVIRKRVSSLDIQLEQVIPLNLDGEPIEAHEDFCVTTLHRKLKILVP